MRCLLGLLRQRLLDFWCHGGEVAADVVNAVKLRDVFQRVVHVPVGHDWVHRAKGGDDFFLLGEDALQTR